MLLKPGDETTRDGEATSTKCGWADGYMGTGFGPWASLLSLMETPSGIWRRSQIGWIRLDVEYVLIVLFRVAQHSRRPHSTLWSAFSGIISLWSLSMSCLCQDPTPCCLLIPILRFSEAPLYLLLHSLLSQLLQSFHGALWKITAHSSQTVVYLNHFSEHPSPSCSNWSLALSRGSCFPYRGPHWRSYSLPGPCRPGGGRGAPCALHCCFRTTLTLPLLKMSISDSQDYVTQYHSSFLLPFFSWSILPTPPPPF